MNTNERKRTQYQTASDTVKWSEWHGGFLAFRHGVALRTIHHHMEVFRTEEQGWEALRKSKMVCGYS